MMFVLFALQTALVGWFPTTSYSPLPVAPSKRDITEFSEKADLFVEYLNTLNTEISCRMKWEEYV